MGTEVLSRDELVKRQRIEEVELHDGKVVCVQPLPFAIAKKIMRKRMEQAASENGGEPQPLDVREIADDLVIYGAVDEAGNRMFKDTEEDREAVDNLDANDGITMAVKIIQITDFFGSVEETEAPEAE